ncbi:ParA family protein [Delftia sp. GW456-R20]|uniref:ParA family protein n=1 Tax=Delftia sp. GW456-R20 TaxID=1827145 RepID=UPI0009ED0116|nr:ParA family protein [Delftia sp. GW456-R20]
MKTLVIANRKGGVGKTTFAVHLGYAAQLLKLRVLLVDMDPQGSLGVSFSAPEGSPPGTLTASKLYGDSVQGLLPEVLGPNLAIIRTDGAMTAAGAVTADGIYDRPRINLATLAADYDLCVIDTPPGAGTHLAASLNSADYVVTPVSMGLYETHGVEKLLHTIADARKEARKAGRKLSYLGVLPTKTNMRRRAEVAQLDELRAAVGDSMLPASLPERAAVRNAVEKRIPVWENVRGESHGKAAAEWRTACQLVISKVME